MSVLEAFLRVKLLLFVFAAYPLLLSRLFYLNIFCNIRYRFGKR